MKCFFALALMLCLAIGSARTVAAQVAPRPNVIFFLIDDMGWSDLSCFGSKRVETPAIDQLAHEGIRFTQFYVAAPICSPSRVGFTTGQFPVRWGITSYLATRREDHDRGIRDWLVPTAPTLARYLHDAGYYTAHVGKWHMGGQRDVGDAPLITSYGFDTSLTSFEGLGERVLPVFEPPPGKKQFNHPPTSMSAALGGGPIHWVKRDEVTAAYVDRALEEIDKAQKADKPFYLNLWPDDVHSPVQAPPALRGDNSPVSNYLGVVVELDHQAKRVFDRVRHDPQLRDNTIIIVASDNGPELPLGSATPLRGSKGQLWEGGIREPFIVWAPKLMASDKVGSTNDSTVVCGVDLLPTVLHLTETAPAASVNSDGVDMSDAWLGKSSAKRVKPLMWVRPPDRPGPKKNWPDLAIRDGDWKLLVFRDGSRPELFNLIDDPVEKNNLAKDHPDILKRLSEQVIGWEKSATPAQ